MTDYVAISLLLIVTLAAFTAGFQLGKSFNAKEPRKIEPTAKIKAASEQINAKEREVQEQIKRQQEAFNMMMNYNQGVAYGISPLDRGTEP